MLLVAGYLVESSRARIMEEKWQATLDKYVVEYFHMKDVPKRRNVFKHLSEEQMDLLAREVIDLIKGHMLYGFVSVVNPSRRIQLLDDTPDGYANCLNQCISKMCSIVKAKHRDQGDKPMIDFFFEAGHPTKSTADRVIRDTSHLPERQAFIDVYRSHKFVGKMERILIQTADILAWQFNKFLSDKVRDARQPRKDFISLMDVKTLTIAEQFNKGRRILANDDWKSLNTHPKWDRLLKSAFMEQPPAGTRVDRGNYLIWNWNAPTIEATTIYSKYQDPISGMVINFSYTLAFTYEGFETECD